MGNRGSRIPEGFWTTKTGRDLCTTMHGCAWDALGCLNAQIDDGCGEGVQMHDGCDEGG